MGEPNTFDEWFSQTEWWHENSRREDFEPVWNSLAAALPGPAIAEIFDRIIAAMRDEYGE